MKLRSIYSAHLQLHYNLQMSFVRANDLGALPPITGVRSWTNGTQLTTSGVAGLDLSLSHQGFPVHSLVLIKQDHPSAYHRTFLRAFIAEGVALGHCVVTASPDQTIAAATLPFVVAPTTKRSSSSSSKALNDKLKISWRYQTQLTQPPATPDKASTGFTFDISRAMQPEIIKANSPYEIALSAPCDPHCDAFYDDLLERIRNQLTAKRCTGTTPFNLARVVLHSLMSPQLGYDPTRPLRPFIRFLHQLRAVARSSSAIVVVSMPTHHLPPQDLARFDHLFDLIIRLDSFVGQEETTYDAFDGGLTFQRLPHLNTWTMPRLGSLEYLFKIKKTDMIVERVSLPVESSRDGAGSGSMCSGELPKQLQF